MLQPHAVLTESTRYDLRIASIVRAAKAVLCHMLLLALFVAAFGPLNIVEGKRLLSREALRTEIEQRLAVIAKVNKRLAVITYG